MIKTILRLVRVEFMKLRRQKLPYIALALVILAVVLPIAGAKKTAQGDSDERQSEDERQSKEEKNTQNGFDVVSEGASNAFQLATLFMLMIASLMFSSELAQGTMRTCLVKPVTRTEFFLGKFLMLLLVTIGIVAFVGLLGAVLTHFTTGFGNITDKRYTDYIYVQKAEMITFTYYALILTVLPILAVMAFGILMSIIIESPGASAMAAVILGLTVHFIVTPVLPSVEPYLPNTYLNFYTDGLGRLSQGDLTQKWKFQIISDFSRVEYACPEHPQEEIKIQAPGKCPVCGHKLTVRKAFYKHTPERRAMVIQSIAIPLIYLIVFTLGAFVMFKRKDILM
ncbi:MAG: ABC transporter permease subunit [Planctomycetes bacterium]|nr:ABC transporter permease subunit [Planctomycetota bacterium]